MLSYLHGYHAGNFADVHKHVVLLQVLQKMQQKTAPLSYLETHAGSGFYALTQPPFPTKSEWREGIGRLWNAPSLPPELSHYRDLVAQANGRQLTHYPGSPLLVSKCLRRSDEMILMELHPQEAPALRVLFQVDKQVHVHQRDGLTGLLALCPTQNSRGLILLDPSYEIKTDYEQLPILIAQVKRRFAGAVIILWYPLLRDEPHQNLLQQFRELGWPQQKVYRCEIVLETTANLYGSGLLVVDLPWQLDQEFAVWGPVLAGLLQGTWQAEWWV